jgi:hypothetical protein
LTFHSLVLPVEPQQGIFDCRLLSGASSKDVIISLTKPLVFKLVYDTQIENYLKSEALSQARPEPIVDDKGITPRRRAIRFR